MKPILADLGLVTVGTEQAWAVTSPDNVYRYILGRTWDGYFYDGDEFGPDAPPPTRPLWVFGMINPSTARGTKPNGEPDNDPTVRKCEGFSRRGGAGGFLVVNAMAYSAADPRDVVKAYRAGIDVCGPVNELALRWALSRPTLFGRHIAAWGRIPPKLRSVAQRGTVQFLCSGAVDCIGVNADGSPRHPLMLGYDTPIVPLRDARYLGGTSARKPTNAEGEVIR